MVRIAPIKLQYNSKVLWFEPGDLEIHKGDAVVVTTARGLEFGHASDDIIEVEESEIKKLKTELKPVKRLADEKDEEDAVRMQEKSKEALPVFKEMAAEISADMRPVSVEFLLDGDKAVFYFEAEERVDFRELVRKLAAHFRVRIDMRQIGVRDEARMVGGLGHCGQELCCKRLGGEFCPVSIRMAKEQDLSLNPQKISGVCGRLMCCLRYEFDAYKEFKERAPKINATIDTPEGAARVVDLNIPLEIVTIKLSSDKTVKIPLAKMEADEKGTRPNKIGKKVFDEYANQTILDSFGSPTFSPFGDKSLADGPLKKERLGEDGGAGSARKEQDTLSSRKPRRRTRSGKAQEAPDAQGESRAQGTTRSNNQAKKSANQKNQGKNAKDQGQAKRRRGKNSEDASSKNGSQGQKRGRPSRQGQGANTSEAGAGTRSTGPRPGQKSSGLRTGEQRSFTEPRKAPTRTRKDSGEAQDSGEYRRSRRRTHTSGGEKSGETE